MGTQKALGSPVAAAVGQGLGQWEQAEVQKVFETSQGALWLAATHSLLPMGAGSGSLSILASHLSPVLRRGHSQGHPSNPQTTLKYVGKGDVEGSMSAFLQVLRVLTSYVFGGNFL